MTGLTPLGLPPVRPAQLPSWEQPHTPAWEQRQLPWWEKQSAPFWEGQQPSRLVNPTRAAQSLYPQPSRGGQHISGKQRRHYKYPPAYYVLPAYGYYTGTTFGYGVSTSTSYVEPPPPPVYEEPLPETGVLQLDVEPRQALQVFVDGLYIGMLADLGEEIELRLGARRIELRAAGYRTLVFDTEIVPDRIIVYRGALERLPQSAALPPQAPKAPQAPETTQAPRSRTMYLIPGCYMGNVEPTASMLRPGCDLSKLTTILPQ